MAADLATACSFAVLASATVEVAVLTERRPGAPFYADPVAWLVADAVAELLRRAGPAVRAAGAHTGIVSVSCEATRHTLRTLSARAGRRVSPMRFAGANAGSIAGLPCIVHGLTGPSLVLAMPPADARDTAAVVARSWLAAGACRFVVINEHESRPGLGHTVRSVLLGAPDHRPDLPLS